MNGVRNTITVLPFATIQLKDSLPGPFWHRHSHFARVLLRETVIREVWGPTRGKLERDSQFVASYQKQRCAHSARRGSSHIKDLVSTLWTHVGAAVDCDSLSHWERQV